MAPASLTLNLYHVGERPGERALRTAYPPFLRARVALGSDRLSREWRNGRRAGFRFRWGNSWRFKSSLAHRSALLGPPHFWWGRALRGPADACAREDWGFREARVQAPSC